MSSLPKPMQVAGALLSRAECARFWLALSFGLVLLAASPRRAFAADVVLVHPANADPYVEEVYHRVRGELRVQAIAFEQDEGGSNESSEPASATLLERGVARACIAFNWQGDATVIRVWVVETPGMPPNLFEAVALERNAEAPTLLAARAVELLSAALRRAERVPPSEKPSSAIKPLRGPVPHPLAPARAWRIGASVSGLDFPSRAGLALGPQLSVSYRVSSQFGVGAQLAAPLLGASVENGEASARLVQGLYALRLEDELARLGPVTLSLNGGAGVHFLHASGSIADGIGSLAASRAQRFTVGLIAGGQAAFDLSARSSFVVEANGVLLIPAPKVGLGRESVGLGEPGIQGCVGLRFTL